MSKKDFTKYFHSKLGVEDSYQAPKRLLEILYDKAEREELFLDMLEFMDYDVSYDWFHQYFQDEHADRKKKKQDFTPNEIGKLLSRLSGAEEGDTYYEIAAGTGGLMIQYWEEQRMKESPFTYSPWNYFHIVEELSDRTVPFLLFNMLIRGMNGIVIHGESLSRNAKGVFFIQNFEDNHLMFSDFNVLPYTEDIEEYFKIQFEWVVNSTDQTSVKKKRKSTKGYYPEHTERSWYDEENWEKISYKLAMRELEREAYGKLEESDLEDEVKEFIKFFGLV